VLAEEWHTAHAVIHLDWLLRRSGLRDRAVLVWTANNWFGFDGVDWPRLSSAARIATVSHYMRRCMEPLGVDPIVIHAARTRAAAGISTMRGELG
jgi:hypothetical protein